jgi:alpha-L-fucosidase 2
MVAVGVLTAFALDGIASETPSDAQTVAKAIPDKAEERLPSDAAITGRAVPPASSMAWWYRSPATKFWEGVPIATGRFGAMLYGRVREEIIPFNDETLWTGQPNNPVNPKALESLPTIRRLVLDGQFAPAAVLAQNLLSYPVPFVQTYQAMGRLHLRFAGHDSVQDYRRELDMDSATARVTYRIGEAHFIREAIASYPDQVIAMRLVCDRPGELTFDVSLSSLHPSAAVRTIGSDTLLMEGGVSQPSGELPSVMRWQARVHVVHEGGTVQTVVHGTDTTLRVEKANAVTILLVGATNYENWNSVSADPNAQCAAYLQGVAGQSYDDLRRRHLADYQPLFHACQLDLGTTPAAQEDTTTRLARLRKPGTIKKPRGATPAKSETPVSASDVADADPQFTAQYFQYGRYLLIAASRPGTQAFNNHNIWLDDLLGRWRGRWTLNINLQECYWPAETASLPSTTDALLTFTERLAQSGARTARGVYGARGWCAHHGTDIWMNTAMTDRVFHGMAPTMGIWVVQSLWEHYLFDPNPEYLARIYPLIKGAAEFGLDMLVEEPKHKWLVSCPSGSPENGFLLKPDGTARYFDEPASESKSDSDEASRNSICAGSAIDTELLRDIFRECTEAATTLKTDEPLRAEIARALPRLAPFQLRKDGLLMEWLEPYLEFDPKHRHVSPLYAAYPSNQITRRGTPELAEAVRKVLEVRGDNHGWSAAWKINLWARLGDAEAAYRIVRMMETDISIHPAPEDSDAVPSMEGNQGIQAYTAGVVEMLLQSHAGEIEMLPALPEAWPSGRVTGLRARGGYTVDLQWHEAKLVTATLRASQNGPCRLRVPPGCHVLTGGRAVETQSVGEGVIEFSAVADSLYTVSPVGPKA